MTGIIVTITICKKKSIMHPNNTQSRHKTHKTIPTVIKENKPSAMHYAQFKRNQPTNLKPVIWSNYYVAGESKSEKKAIESAEALIKIVTA